MYEISGKVQKASTHAASLIMMYLAVAEIHHCAWVRVSAGAIVRNVKASALPNKEGREMSGQLHPTG